MPHYLYWNIKQKGVGFLHLAHLAGVYDHPDSAGKIISNMLEFLVGQIAFLLPFYQYRKLYQKFIQKSLTKQEEFLILPALTIFIAFLFIAAIRQSGAYINWTIYAYTGIPLLFAHFTIDQNRKKLNLQISRIMAFSLCLFIFLCLPANKIFPLETHNPLNKTVGWSQLAKKIDSMTVDLPGGSLFVFSTNYHITSELWFYLKNQPETFVLNMNSRMTQFDLWPGIEQFINTGKTGVYVDLSKITPEIRKGFSTMQKEDSCIIISQNESVCTYYIYFMQGLKGFPKQHSSY